MSSGRARKYDWYPYHVCRNHGLWAVYKYEDDRRMYSQKVRSFVSYADARNEAYRLNSKEKH